VIDIYILLLLIRGQLLAHSILQEPIITPIAIQSSRQDDDLLVRKPARSTRQVGLRAGHLLDACTTRLVIMTVVQLSFPIKP
jgi:hypothetical protein